MERKIRQRLVFQQTYQQQTLFKELRRQQEKEEEEAFRQKMMAKYAEDDRIEQMNAQRRRMKQLEHKRAVQQLIEERRQQHEADKVLGLTTTYYIHVGPSAGSQQHTTYTLDLRLADLQHTCMFHFLTSRLGRYDGITVYQGI